MNEDLKIIESPPNRKALVKKLDTRWSEIVRSVGRCELCGKTDGKLDAHHIEGRSPQALRWGLKNGISLCFQCHRLGVHSEASSVQAAFREKITTLRGKKTMDELKAKRYQMQKLSTGELRELLISLTQKV